ncbi:MAG: beta-ribofuranosylaminobenzene 5'-phosphate synthase, partial [Methanoregulaceae archaeon]|nr:beta-ribofuranosylaminobenzene 5'-phosphate synthase [Methanoregulaceae archaeon]
EIKNAGSGEVLIYAISYTPLNHLPDEFLNDLLRADIPIGKIITQHRIEARREILTVDVRPASGETTELFKMCRNEPLLSREYQIIHGGRPLIVIQEQFPYNKFLDERRVIIETPSRLHLGLIDMNGTSGRVDGGVGIALEDPRLLMEAHISDKMTVHGGDEWSRDTVLSVAGRVLDKLKIPGGLAVTLRNQFRQHAGLGSGTQLSLATAGVICELYNRPCSPRDLAILAGRGGTSGIGTGAFEQGGFLIDGGHNFGEGKEKSVFSPSGASRGIRPAPVIIHHDFPRDWNILLVIPNLPPGASGRREQDIFSHYCPVPNDEVREICHEILMHMVPGIVEHDLDLFARAVDRIQEIGFKRVELGLQHKEIPALLRVMRDAGAACAGMSSFGPTLYAIGDSDLCNVQDAARKHMELLGGGTTILTRARNTGAAVRSMGT